MASAWGNSWGVSWGNAWGLLDEEPQPEPEPIPIRVSGGGRVAPTVRKRRAPLRNLTRHFREDDELLCILAGWLLLKEKT